MGGGPYFTVITSTSAVTIAATARASHSIIAAGLPLQGRHAMLPLHAPRIIGPCIEPRNVPRAIARLATPRRSLKPLCTYGRQTHVSVASFLHQAVPYHHVLVLCVPPQCVQTAQSDGAVLTMYSTALDTRDYTLAV